MVVTFSGDTVIYADPFGRNFSQRNCEHVYKSISPTDSMFIDQFHAIDVFDRKRTTRMIQGIWDQEREYATSKR